MIEKDNVYIIIVNFNGYRDTINCINSLKRMSYSTYKIIVVDNDSTDISIEVLSRIDDIILIKNKKNLGYAGGNNIGIRYALDKKCDYILILNNDTLVEKDFLEILISNAKNSANFGVGGCKILDSANEIWFAGGKILRKLGTMKIYTAPRISNTSEVSFLTGCCLLVNKEVFDKIGLFDERYFMYFEDVQFCLRTQQNGFKLYYYPNIKIKHLVKNSTEYDSFTAYFTLRNRQIFIKEELNNAFIPRLLFYSVNYLKILIFWIKGDKLYKHILKAIKDYKSGHFGNSYDKNIS